jgi:hypothetical protein
MESIAFAQKVKFSLIHDDRRSNNYYMRSYLAQKAEGTGNARPLSLLKLSLFYYRET